METAKGRIKCVKKDRAAERKLQNQIMRWRLLDSMLVGGLSGKRERRS